MFKLRWMLFIVTMLFFFNCDKKEKENNPITPEPPKFILSDFYGTWLDTTDSIETTIQYFEPDSFLRKIIDYTKFGGISWTVGSFLINDDGIIEHAFFSDSIWNKTGVLDIGGIYERVDFIEDSLKLYRDINGSLLLFEGKSIQTPLR